MSVRTVTHTRTHVQIGFANPYLKCETCKKPVPYWHDPNPCGCTDDLFNYPCGHKLGTFSTCPSWSPVDGCMCEIPCKK
jgi:hypothetical protein